MGNDPKPIGTDKWKLMLLAFGLITAISAYFCVSCVRGPMNWDEGKYFQAAASIADDVVQIDFPSFYSHTNRQRVHPFLYSWLTAPVLVMGSLSIQALLMPNLIILAVLPIIVFILFTRFIPELTRFQAMCFGLLITSSPVVMEYASVFMPELMGIAFLLIAQMLCAHYVAHPTKRRALLAGIMLPMVFFLKFSLGIILIGALLLIMAGHVLKYRNFGKYQGILWGPIVVTGLIWFLTPVSAKIRGFLSYTINRTMSGRSIGDRAIMYGRILLEMISAQPILSILVLLLATLGVIAAFRSRFARFHTLCALMSFSGMIVHSYAVARLTTHLIPSIWALAATGLAVLYRGA